MKSNSLWAIVILGGFVALFFWLRSIDWVGLFDLERHSRDTEEKLGDLFWEHIGDEGEQITDSATVAAMDSLIVRLCDANAIPREHIKVHVFRADVVNAFAMPGGHLVVNSALIEDCKSPEQLCGVLAHEIAHIELRHVMNKLVREVGTAVLISITTGGSDAGQVGEVVGSLSSKAFDRDMEREADLTAVEYLTKAQIDPHPFADFLYLTGNGETEEAFEWLSTHPASKERMEYVLEEIGKRQFEVKPVIAGWTWEQLKTNMESADILQSH
jgi:predicted Zn-dependent protease